MATNLRTSSKSNRTKAIKTLSCSYSPSACFILKPLKQGLRSAMPNIVIIKFLQNKARITNPRQPCVVCIVKHNWHGKHFRAIYYECFVMLNGSEASPLGRYKTLRYLRVTRTLLFTFLSC